MRASKRQTNRTRGSGKRNINELNDNSLQQRQGLLSPETKSFLYGIGAGILLSALFPQIKEGVKPVAVGTVKGTKGIVNKVQEMVSEVREGVEDIVAEARFENLKQALDKDLMSDLSTDTIEETK